MPKIGRFTNKKNRQIFMDAYEVVAAKWPVPSTVLDVETSFGTTRVRRSGQGAGVPLLLLPGIGGNGLGWYRFIEDLAREHVVYTPDVIGWAGRCVQTAPVRDTEDVAKWMGEVLDGLNEDRVHIAGNSLGAWLSGAVAVYRSERLASLTMIEPSASTFAKPQFRLLLKFLVAGVNPTPERMRKFNKWLMPGFDMNDDEFALAMAAIKFRMAMPWDRMFTDEQLAAISVPTLVLFGAETIAGDPEVGAARARQHIALSDVEIYPNIGHDLMWANPDQIIPRLLDFTDSNDPVRS